MSLGQISLRSCRFEEVLDQRVLETGEPEISKCYISVMSDITLNYTQSSEDGVYKADGYLIFFKLDR